MRNLWLLGLIAGMAAVVAASVTPAMGAPILVALKEGSALTTGTSPALNAAFGNGSLATITNVAVDDTAFSTNVLDNVFHGTDTSVGASYDKLFKFDLRLCPDSSAVPCRSPSCASTGAAETPMVLD